METEEFVCCTCDEQFPKEDVRKLKTNGLAQGFYICLTCLEDVPLLKGQLEEMVNVEC